MSHRINVGDRIEFTGEARHKANVTGDFNTERTYSVDWYDQRALNTTNDYTQTLGGESDAGALIATGEPGFLGTTGTGDNEAAFLGTGLIFDISNSPAIETKLKITDVSGTAVFWGFSDAVLESTPDMPIDADSGTAAAAATDAVGFVIDADLSTSSLYCMAVNNGGTVATADTGIDWADGESRVLKIELDSSGNAKFFVDGLQKGYIASAVADVAAGFCEIKAYATRDNDGSNTVTWRYLKKWQDIP